jgi:thymidylate synthase (FAD)
MRSKETRRHKDAQLDKILGQKYEVLDDGFIRVVDYLGSDSTIVQAARVSYGAGTKKSSEDRALINYLMRHRHTTPFEMCELKLHLRVPMDCWRQWIRHRTANVNEYSTRYSIAIDSARTTKPDEWRMQSTANKQGSGNNIDVTLGERLTKSEKELQLYCRKVYEERIRLGVAREQARKDLPLSTYTEAYWKIDLHNLLHFLALRMAPEAQYEIRQYANIIGHEIVKKWVPMTWEAFLDYRLNSLTLSSKEISIVSNLINDKPDEALKIMCKNGMLTMENKKWKQTGEAREFEKKLKGLGINIPW